MHLRRLSLTNFRNYVRLEMTFPVGLSIVQGENAQGKSNLLEAITYLATSRSQRTNTDAELVNWLTREEPYSYTRLEAEIQKDERVERVDITLTPGQGGGSSFRKQVRINAVSRRAIDLVGLMQVVVFRPEDVDLVAGTPSLRRRYLDIALCQIEPTYCRALSQYNKTLSQRNALLRQLREGGDAATQLRYWDEKLAETGGLVVARRQWLINELDNEASLRHLDLSGGAERLKMRYLPSFDPGQVSSRRSRGNGERAAVRYEDLTPKGVRAVFLAKLHTGRGRDVAAGMTLVGPHRDDLAFRLGDRNLRNYGSRGQQRTAALASKMAELAIMTRVSGTEPLLLLDDVMSELDANRRAMLLDTLASTPQAIVTTTDWHHFSEELLAQSHKLHVHDGQMQTLDSVPNG